MIGSGTHCCILCPHRRDIQKQELYTHDIKVMLEAGRSGMVYPVGHSAHQVLL